MILVMMKSGLNSIRSNGTHVLVYERKGGPRIQVASCLGTNRTDCNPRKCIPDTWILSGPCHSGPC